MNVLIKAWNEELITLAKREDVLKKAIKAIQTACPHKDMIESSYDSHKTYYTCTECGYENYC